VHKFIENNLKHHQLRLEKDVKKSKKVMQKRCAPQRDAPF
jgi:hypothetical protein